jgi:hypothetical protein
VIDPYTGIVEWVYKIKPLDGGPKYGPKAGRKTDYRVYLSAAALKSDAIELLVFFHGDLGPACTLVFDPKVDWKTKNKTFQLDQQIEKTGRPVVLIVPFVYWKGRDTSEVDGKWRASRLNAFIEEVLKNVNKKWETTPRLKCLVVAGHSRAHVILNSLASEFRRTPEDMKKLGNLAKLKQVWALDSTYCPGSVRALQMWATTLHDTCQFTAVLKKGTATILSWSSVYPFSLLPDGSVHYTGKKPPANLRMLPVRQEHCDIPGQYVHTLLSTMPTCQ